MVVTASSTLFALQTGTTDLFASSGAREIFLLARILFGGVLAFLAVGMVNWPYALNIGLFL